MIPSFATPLDTKMKTQGPYRHGWPEGAVIHYTAGRGDTDQNAIDTLEGGADSGLCYVIIGPSGKLFISHPINEWGYHAGQSAWPQLGQGVSRFLIGIEIACAGKLEHRMSIAKDENVFAAPFGQLFHVEQIRYTPGVDNQVPGYYKKFTDAQEETLQKFLFWLKDGRPEIFDFDLVLGHDEVSGLKGIGWQRKQDPGASLSMTMGDYREHLKQGYQSRTAAPVNP